MASTPAGEGSPLGDQSPPADTVNCGVDGVVGDLLCVKAVSSSQLIFSLLVYSAAGLAFLVVFCLVWPHAVIYTTRLHFSRVSIKPPRLYTDGSSPGKWLYRLVAWLGPVLCTDKHAFIRTCGLDGYVLSRIMVRLVSGTSFTRHILLLGFFFFSRGC